MSSTPCYTCGGNVADMSGVAQLKRIERLIADNYTVIGLSVGISVLLFIIIWYFGKQMYEVIRNYRKSYISLKSSMPSTTDDSEIYDDDDKVYDVAQYFDPGKNDFVKAVETAYKDYNKLKTDYIRTNHMDDNDDTIGKDTMFYKKYDDYQYKEKEKDT